MHSLSQQRYVALQSLQGSAIKYIAQDEMKWYVINIVLAELGKISVIYFTWRKHVMLSTDSIHIAPLCPKQKRHTVKVYSFHENWGMADIVDSFPK